MGPKRIAAALSLLSVITASGVAARSLMPITDCAGLSRLNDELQHTDVRAEIRSNELVCDVWTTIVVPLNTQLTIEGEDPDYRVKFTNIRFEVQAQERSGDSDQHYDLVFSPNVKLYSSIEANVFDGTQDVNGGALHVQSGAAVQFKGYMRCVGISIASALIPDGGGWDDPVHKNNGGCWYNEGRIMANGHAWFEECENAGGGENQPGGGGAVYNGASGLIEFAGGIKAKKNDCNDDEGGKGGAIYNAGLIVIREIAEFPSNIGGWGGAIYNDEGGVINFETNGKVSFFKNRHSVHNELSGHIHNSGSIKFASYVKFLRGEGVFTEGLIEFNGGGLFRRETEGAIFASEGFDFGDTLPLVEFKKNVAGRSGCEDLIYFDEGQFVCGPSDT